MPRFEEALITGASSGLGRALALRLAERGAHVHLVARRADALAELSAEIGAAGGHATSHAVDVTRPAALRDLMEAADARRPAGLDLVVANAGIGGNALDTKDAVEIADAVFDVNLSAAVHTFEHAVRLMRPRRRGTIATMSSLASIRGMPGAAAYCASKAALSSYAESRRGDLRGSGLSVVDIRPGFVRTPMTDRNRFPMPFLLEPGPAAARMVKACEKGRPVCAFPRRLAWPLTAAARLLPTSPWARITGGKPRG